MPSEIVFRLREELEDRDATQTGGLNAILTAALAVVPVYTRINAIEDYYKIRPRVDLKCSVGAATGRRFLCPDGLLRYDAFHFVAGLQVITEPRNIPANNEMHEQMISTCRKVMSGIGGNESAADVVNFPNVLIAEVLKDSGVSDSSVDEKDGLEYTTIGYEGIVCIRPQAW